MDEDGSGGEGVFEVLEGGVTGVTEVLENTFAGEVLCLVLGKRQV